MKTNINYDNLNEINKISNLIYDVKFSEEEKLKELLKQSALLYLDTGIPVIPLLKNAKTINILFLLSNDNFLKTINDKHKQKVILDAYKSCINTINKYPKIYVNILDEFFLLSAIDKNKYIDFLSKNIDNIPFYNIGIPFFKNFDIVSFDTDNLESTELLMSFSEFRNTLKVKTKKGYHFYIQIADPEKIPSNFSDVFLFKDYKKIYIDLRIMCNYMVAPPSKVKKHVYRWEVNEIIKLKWNDLQKIMRQIKTKCFINNLFEVSDTRKNVKIEHIYSRK